MEVSMMYVQILNSGGCWTVLPVRSRTTWSLVRGAEFRIHPCDRVSQIKHDWHESPNHQSNQSRISCCCCWKSCFYYDTVLIHSFEFDQGDAIEVVCRLILWRGFSITPAVLMKAEWIWFGTSSWSVEDDKNSTMFYHTYVPWLPSATGIQEVEVCFPFSKSVESGKWMVGS